MRFIEPHRDVHGRPLRSLRISVTDRCNLRCQYCMPEDNYIWLPHPEVLRFEEISTLADVFIALGVENIRLTGGEPLLRRDLPRLVEMLAAKPGVRDLAMTTNAVLLEKHARRLAGAGLRRVTISLDTLRAERYRQLAGRDRLSETLAGIDAARAAGLGPLKINMVVIRGVNDDELVEMVRFARLHDAEVRFIEYMDVGGATRWSLNRVMSQEEIIRTLEPALGTLRPARTDAHAPAERFLLPDGSSLGIIASTTQPFCRACDRSRLTADGHWLLCLYAQRGLDLRERLRGGASHAELCALIGSVWQGRTDRGAELRAGQAERGPFVPLTALRSDAHLEMHTRGG